MIAVSGAGYNLTDQQTYALGDDPRFYARSAFGLARLTPIGRNEASDRSAREATRRHFC